MSRKQKRLEYQQSPGGLVTRSSTLLVSADALLWHALQDRGSGKFAPTADPRTHISDYVPGGIELVWTAFDTFVAESATNAMMFDIPKDPLFADGSAADRLRILSEHQGEPSYLLDPETILLGRVRGEIAHFVPRRPRGASEGPDFMDELAVRELTADSAQPTGNWDWPQRLNSFRLLVWAFQVVEAEVRRAAPLLREGWTSQNFSRFRRFVPPDLLYVPPSRDSG